MTVIVFIASVVMSYLVGAIPAGYLITKRMTGLDVRQHGSSNVGATNVYRVAGKWPGILTLIFDIAKGVFVVTALYSFSYRFMDRVDPDFYRCLLGLAVIVGHIWSLFLSFKGGKGVATTIGVVSVIAPVAFILSLVGWVIVYAMTKYVSLASITFGLLLPLCAVAIGDSIYVTAFAAVLCAINAYKHAANVKRLLRGTENMTILGKRKSG